MKISLQLLLVSWFTLATSDGVEHVFPSNAETTYKWTAEVSTGVTLPGSNDNHASYFAFNANLRVRTDGTNKVFFKIENMTHSAYNGPVKDDKSKSPKEEHEFVETCKDCGTVFAAVYDKGKISNIELDESDKLYVRNKKRAIISQFQLDFQHIPSSLAFTSSEQGVTGLCHLVQSVQFHHDKDFVSLRKFFNNNNCTGKHERKENLSFNQCSQSTSNPVSHTTQRNYKLGKKVKLFVSTVKSRSSIVTQPHGLETEAYFHVTTQNVETISSNPARDDEWSIGKTISTSLLFEFPEENLETGEDIDMSFGNIVYDPEITVNKTMKILKTLGEHLKSTENLNPEQLHALDMKREIATGFLRQMNTESLKTLGEMIVQTEDRTIRNIALEVLPRIGTLASVRVIMGMKHKVKNYEFDRMIVELPFHLRHRSLELLEVCKDLMNFRNSSELLVYSAIVGEVCEKIECPDVFDLIKSFFEKMQASADYGTKLLYLQALGNIHLDIVAKYLEPIIRDKVNYPHTLRFAAVQAAYPTQVTRPGKAHELYWPILQDKTEQNDMRHAALTVLIISNPTTERFLDLLWFINTTEDPDICNMFYTTVKSLFETNHPCFQQLSISVEEVIRLMPKRKVPSYASFTSIMDYEDPESGNGIKFQTMMISDVNTGFPNILYLDAVPHYNGIVGSAMSLHLRMDGDAFRDLIGSASSWVHWDQTNEFKILKLLQSIGVIARDAIPAHIEIIMKRNGRTVLCEYMNKYIIFELQRLFKRKLFGTWIDVDDMTSPLVVKFNGQFLDESTTRETVLANDVGIPVTLFMKQPGLLSLVGDMTIIDGRNASLHPNFGLRYLGHQSHGIYSLNPAMSLWHGVSRSRTEYLHLRWDTKYSLIEGRKKALIAMEWNNDNTTAFTAISHVNTMTYLKGAGAEFGSLDVMCPKCEVYHIVSSKPLQNISIIETAKHNAQFQLQYDVFDCEHPEELKDKQRFFKAFSSNAHKNKRTSVWLKPLLGLMEMTELYVRTPTTGSCGQSMRVNFVGKASKLEIMIFELEKKIEIHYKDTEGKSLKSWIGAIDFNITSTNMTVENTFILQLRHKIEDESFDVTCFRMDLDYNKRHHDSRNFNQLYEPYVKSINVRNVEIIVGKSMDGKCPKKTESQFSISSALSWKTPKNDILEKCEADRGNNRFYPATENCFKAVTHLSNTRNVTINVKTNNLSTELSKFGNLMVSTIHRMLPETVPERLPSEFNVDLEFDGEGKFAAWVTGAENPGKWYDIDTPDVIKYYLDGQRIDSIYSVQSCYAAGDRVNTYDGTSIKYNAVPKWTLFTAHCVAQPVFAFFTRKIEGSDMLSLRIHLFNDVIEVIPTESKPIIMINDEPYESFNDTTMPDHLWSEVGDDYIYMTMRRIPVLVLFSNKYLEVTTTYDVAGWTCGMCGDYNQWPETSFNFPGPDGKPINLEDVSRIYTLP